MNEVASIERGSLFTYINMHFAFALDGMEWNSLHPTGSDPHKRMIWH